MIKTIDPFLSIIIPSHNNLSNLKKCIASISSQVFTNYEVWVIDGDSNDGTITYLKSLRFPIQWVSEKDCGVYDAMNKGISLAKGEWLYFLGADDMLYDDSVLQKVFATTYINSDLLIGNIQYNYQSDDSFALKSKNGLVVSELSKKIWFKNVLHHQSLLYRKQVFEELRYSLNYKILGDYALNLRLFQQNVISEKLDVVIAKCGSKGISKNYDWNLYKEEIQLKTEISSWICYPLFFMVSLIKFLIKKF